MHTHTHSAIDMIYLLVLSGVLLYVSGVAGVNALELNIAVKSGSSVILPCVYDKQYKENRKYLCKGQFRSTCLILAYAGQTGRYSIPDYPDQSIFTVRWDNLLKSDSGYYWCAVEIGGYDISYYLYLTVLTVPDVSVMNSSVSGHEGDDVSVQCLYSSEYKNRLKQWCRYKDKDCYTVGRTDTSQSSSVQISDDGRSSFTVLMTGLRLSDSGWFLCSVGDQQVPVQLTVKPKPVTRILTATPSDPETDKDTTQASANRNPTSVNEIINTVMITDLRPETHIDEAHPSATVNREHRQDKQNKPDMILLMSLVSTLVLFLLVSLVVIVTWMLRKKLERGHIREEEHLNPTSNTTASENQMTSIHPAAATSSASVDDCSVIYSSVIPKKGRKKKAALSSVDPKGDLIYSSVNKPRKPALSSVDPEGDVIYSSVNKPRKPVSLYPYPYTPCSLMTL
ncbi:CMRF35-like molecule 1 [Pimephales promelas]|uniref:CMRF35-like molecule 1 n=1 Tax=Pimephales promelas TaxID=90988 RepID=UPI0019557FEA|nr:CMRF35-like molecule 1 [Pimephales promelas]